MRRRPGLNDVLSACSVAGSGTTTGGRRFSCLAQSGNMVKCTESTESTESREGTAYFWDTFRMPLGYFWDTLVILFGYFWDTFWILFG